MEFICSSAGFPDTKAGDIHIAGYHKRLLHTGCKTKVRVNRESNDMFIISLLYLVLKMITTMKWFYVNRVICCDHHVICVIQNKMWLNPWMCLGLASMFHVGSWRCNADDLQIWVLLDKMCMII